MHRPAGKGVGALKVELVALLDVAPTVTPLVDAVLEVGIENVDG